MDVYLIFLEFYFLFYVIASGFNFGLICIFNLSIYLIYLSTPRNTQHSMMQSCKTSLGFLNPYILLDGEIPDLAMPQSASHSRKLMLKGQFLTWGLVVSGVLLCLPLRIQRQQLLLTIPTPTPVIPGQQQHVHLISLSMLRTTNFHVVDLMTVYFLNMKAISAVPHPQCQNKNATFLILSEHFAAKSLFPALLPQVPL